MLKEKAADQPQCKVGLCISLILGILLLLFKEETRLWNTIRTSTMIDKEEDFPPTGLNMSLTYTLTHVAGNKVKVCITVILNIIV